VDLPRGRQSGLVQAKRVLENIPGIGIVYLDQQDVVRNPLVQRIIQAYETEKAAVDGADALPDRGIVGT
jgi:phosphate starvation-inducible PhoH-like protein